MRIAQNSGRPRPDIGLRVLETMMAAAADGLIGLTLFPILLVNQMEGSYQVAPISGLVNLPDDKRTADGTYNRGSVEDEWGFYRTADRGLEAVIDRRSVAMYGGTTEAMMIGAALKTKEMLRAHEKRCADLALSTTVFTNVAASKKWDASDAKPKTDVLGRVAVMRAAGVMPNQIAFDYDVYQALQQCPDVQAVVYQLFPDAAKNGTINKQHLETYFGFPIAISGAQYNASEPGKAVALSPIWDKTKVWIGRVRKPNATFMDYTDPHVGNTFVYNEGQSETEPFLAEDYPEEASRSDIVRVRADLVASYLQSFKEDMTPLSEVYKRCGNIIHTVL